jgi:hypothetical protein
LTTDTQYQEELMNVNDSEPASRVTGDPLATARAAAVELEAMRIDIEAGLCGDTLELTLEAIARELSDATALCADDVVMVIGAIVVGELVNGGAVIEHDLADHAQLPHQLHRAEHGCASHRGRSVLNFFGREVVAETSHRVEHDTAWTGQAVATAGERSFDWIGDCHAFIVPRVIPLCQRGAFQA